MASNDIDHTAALGKRTVGTEIGGSGTIRAETKLIAMIDLQMPGFRRLRLNHLVLDYNGTIALDGKPIAGVGKRLAALSADLSIHVLTADTFGTAAKSLAGFPCTIHILARSGQDRAKRRYVKSLGASRVVCIGNGRNDRLMLKAAALAIAVIQKEGAASAAVSAAHVVAPDIIDALELLDHPLRLLATLRS